MSIIIETHLECDNCHETFGVDNRHYGSKDQRKSAKLNNWRFYNGKDYCPKCHFCTPFKTKTTQNE